MFSLAFSDYCFCPQKVKQERDWNFNFRLLSTENCFSLRNQCFAKMRQIHISMIHHKTISVLLQKYRIDKFSINIKSKYPTSFSYQVNCVCVRWKIHLCCLPKTLVSYFSLRISAMKWYQQISEMILGRPYESCAWEFFENKPKFDLTLATTYELVDQKQWIILHFSATSIPPFRLFWS